jgi:hypothetical protein
MIHPELAELKTWERSEYAAGYGPRLSAIPKSEAGHYCWRVGWDDADTELLESERPKKVLAEGGEDDFAATWGVLFDAGGDARVNGIRSTGLAHNRGKKVGSTPISTSA